MPLMKHRTLFLIIAFIILLCGAGSVFAKGSSHPKAGGGESSFVPIENAARAMHFGTDQIWQNQDGAIMVCPLRFVAKDYGGTDRQCFDKNDKTKKDQWVYLENLTLDGFEQAGVDFRFTGSYGSKNLIVYWRRAQAPAPEPKAPSNSNVGNATLNVGTITINANTVVVKRAKRPAKIEKAVVYQPEDRKP